MKAENIKYGNLTCRFIRQPDSDRAAYLLYPMDTPGGWIEAASHRYGISIAVITGMDWDNDLTPWRARGVPEGSPEFRGMAPEFLNTLTETVIPGLERHMGFRTSPERTLIGVSLSGLFSLWQWPQSDFFGNIATLSGSFWYEGFTEWLLSQPLAGKTGRCFMLLGDMEPHSRNPVFATVGKNTAEIVGYLRRQGIAVTYNIVKGNHYQYPLQRLELALSHMYGHPAS